MEITPPSFAAAESPAPTAEPAAAPEVRPRPAPARERHPLDIPVPERGVTWRAILLGTLLIPINTYLKVRGSRTSLTLEVQATGGQGVFQQAQDDASVIMRSRRHVRAGHEDDFFIGTSQSYMSLWQSISSAFFAVFVMVSSISAVVGGIVIMNVMLVSVTERTKEIGVRRAVGATQRDILRQFLTESVMQCVVGGLVGIAIGFACALALRTYTSFPASVKTWVALLGVFLSSVIGVFFGIYPAVKASKLDPVTALRSE